MEVELVNKSFAEDCFKSVVIDENSFIRCRPKILFKINGDYKTEYLGSLACKTLKNMKSHPTPKRILQIIKSCNKHENTTRN